MLVSGSVLVVIRVVHLLRSRLVSSLGCGLFTVSYRWRMVILVVSTVGRASLAWPSLLVGFLVVRC